MYWEFKKLKEAKEAFKKGLSELSIKVKEYFQTSDLKRKLVKKERKYLDEIEFQKGLIELYENGILAGQEKIKGLEEGIIEKQKIIKKLQTDVKKIQKVIKLE